MLVRRIFKVPALLLRCLHKGTECGQLEKQYEEIQIPVPWGHVAGKWWGKQGVEPPLLALHGVLDNAATFDKLVPLLDVPSVLALDFPGQGLSSHLPLGITYHYMDVPLLLRYIINLHFKWDRVSCIGHSFGSSYAFVYSALYPDNIHKFVSLDCTRSVGCPSLSKTVSDLNVAILKLLEYENRIITNTPPKFTFDELAELMYESRKHFLPLTLDSCKILLSRSACQCGDESYYDMNDLRLKAKSFGKLTDDYILALSKNIKCEILNLEANNGPLKKIGEATYHQSLDLIKKSAKTFQYNLIDGGHHVHLEEPEKVAPIINKFLTT